jgi:hypothetical protein
MEDSMHYLMTTIAAGALGVAALTFPVPASAQVDVEVGAPGVGVRVGDREHRRYEERRRVRVYDDDNTGSCRTVTIRRERGDGTVVTRRERRCD